MSALIGSAAEKFAVIHTVDTELWNSMATFSEQEKYVRERLLQALTNSPEVAGWLDETFEWRFVEMPEYWNFAQHEQQDVVAYRATIMAYRKGAADG